MLKYKIKTTLLACDCCGSEFWRKSSCIHKGEGIQVFFNKEHQYRYYSNKRENKALTSTEQLMDKYLTSPNPANLGGLLV